jgi:hypothetical protein
MVCLITTLPLLICIACTCIDIMYLVPVLYSLPTFVKPHLRPICVHYHVELRDKQITHHFRQVLFPTHIHQSIEKYFVIAREGLNKWVSPEIEAQYLYLEVTFVHRASFFLHLH